MVYRVTGPETGTEQFSRLQAGDKIEIVGPLGNGFPLEKAAGKRAMLMGGGIGVPPILELAKELAGELEPAQKKIVVGYRDSQTFLKEEFEQNGALYLSTEDGSVGTKGNVMDAVRENQLDADIIYACGPTPMLRAIKAYAQENGIECYISLEESDGLRDRRMPGLRLQEQRKDEHSNVHNKRVCKERPGIPGFGGGNLNEYEDQHSGSGVEKSRNSRLRHVWIRRRVFGIC